MDHIPPSRHAKFDCGVRGSVFRVNYEVLKACTESWFGSLGLRGSEAPGLPPQHWNSCDVLRIRIAVYLLAVSMDWTNFIPIEAPNDIVDCMFCSIDKPLNCRSSLYNPKLTYI